jgi:hypothetical protein
MVDTCESPVPEDPWVEYGYEDPESIPWAKMKEALEVLGIDTTHRGAEFLELHIYDRRVEIKRTRQSVDGRFALWSITKEIVIS